jgi:Protein of unknown function (DUF3999)
MKTLTAASVFLLTLLFADSREARLAYFTHVREIENVQPERQNYFDVDDEMWAHARADLGDMRLYAAEKEIPYRLAVEHASSGHREAEAKILQLGRVGENTSFIIEAPGSEEYNRVDLRLDTKNFVARANVEGMDDLHDRRPTRIGPYTLYDFTHEGLGSSFTLKLPASRFRYLRIVLSKDVPPADVKAAVLRFQQEKKAGYTVIGASPKIEQKDKETVITWSASEKVPLDRIQFEVDQMNFLRSVRVQDADGHWVGSGEISRVNMVRSGKLVESSCLTIETGGTRSRSFTVTIANGDDPPLRVSVTPQFVTRRVYFDPRAERSVRLYYGDEKLSSPSYEYAKLGEVETNPARAQLARGTNNAAYTGRPDDRPWSERHPALLWVVMVVAVAALGTVALRGLRKPV